MLWGPFARMVTEEFEDLFCWSQAPTHSSGFFPRAGLPEGLSSGLLSRALSTNAAKYGSGKPIEVALDAKGRRARLTVRDHGIGIAAEDQARIFEPFERAVSTRHYGGFGLGLWIVRQIIESMGGSIRVESVPGEGSTFTVELGCEEVRGDQAGPEETVLPY
jgi:K+-sensing histidine kinase KdpD